MAKKALIEKHKNGKFKFSVRGYNRCQVCGNPRGFMRRFKICRKCFREMAHRAELPGVMKASW
ncbi:type Z 30S ribosomal protein S14 [Patescibacteria group bacterium]|nr:type Z 30S ribosomal protein S14 [Patescibacteria group bacterium]